MASEPNILKRDGGALSSGNSTLMQRERGKKEAKAGKRKQRFGRSLKSAGRRAGIARGGPGVGRRPGVGRGWAGCRARAGGEKSGGTVGKRQRGSKLSNKQEKAKGKAQESRHQNQFPPLFDRAPPSRLNIRGLEAFFENQRSQF